MKQCVGRVSRLEATAEPEGLVVDIAPLQFTQVVTFNFIKFLFNLLILLNQIYLTFLQKKYSKLLLFI
ncbi:hypothetical protein BV372_07715 [Nostoc sp. T09]|nr:hypothetical protein BV372_07715 [Nostoc sp. T09]